ncbi:MAG: aquaporin family protein [Nocardioides sp.]|uniref:MIP/aquaporin family protein n=1 Tax=Nocardioides sp. TaxID=35761 RepID=UPI0026390565|nr:aquaporin [Nocardioides sp.]MCW2835433.1 aquaporin family protein [Nocardioides sp.]
MPSQTIESQEHRAPQPPTGGLHLSEWGAELAGTAILVFVALSNATVLFHPGWVFEDWIPSESARRVLLGTVFVAGLTTIARSPLGRLSGAHLNPAVTLAFWITGHVHPHDLVGYWAAQLTGGALGAFALRIAWGQTAADIDYGAITPEVAPWAGVLVEALMVGLVVCAVFGCLSTHALVRWTPLVAGTVVTLNYWLGAPFTHSGLNPARTLGPNLVTGQWQDWWVYVVGPLAGAALVAVAWRMAPRVILTAKLFHDPDYRSVLRTHLPARGPAVAQTPGSPAPEPYEPL